MHETFDEGPTSGITVADLCMYGMTTMGKDGCRHPVRKATRFWCSSNEVLSQLSGRCPKLPQHIHLLVGKAKFAAIYPPQLCRAIIKAYHGMHQTPRGTIGTKTKRRQSCRTGLSTAKSTATSVHQSHFEGRSVPSTRRLLSLPSEGRDLSQCTHTHILCKAAKA